MDQNRLLLLLNKLKNKEISSEELAELNDWYAQLDSGEQNLLVQDKEAMELLARQKLAELRERLAAQTPVRLIRRRWLGVAAAVAGLILAGTLVWRVMDQQPAGPVSIVAQKAANPSSFIRNLVLPDGSTVVLQKGSRIELAAGFDSSYRELTLEGEAYFDIAHHAPGGGSESLNAPFLIHTGEVTTTVLGTAFNIKAYPEQPNVVVSVTQGKVKVEKGKQVLAVLTQGHQIDYMPALAKLIKKEVNTDTVVTNWTHEDMVFDGMPLGEITKKLEQRYGVEIRFSTPDLKNCLTVFSFSGTESLESVLEVLAQIHNAHYEVNGKQVLISGTGCPA